MSISNLLVPNEYDLFCKTITANEVILPGDVAETSIGVSLFNGTSPSGGDIWRGGITIKYKIVAGVCSVWMGSSSGNFGNGKTGTPSSLKLGPLGTDPVNGYFPVGSLPMVDSGDGNIYLSYQLKASNTRVTGSIDINSGVGTGSDQVQIVIRLLGGATFNNGADDNDLLNFYFEYPVA